MKFYIHSSTSTHKNPKKKGFALLATMLLMALLALVAVGLLSMVRSQERISMQKVLRAEARQQALVGLDAAIGKLQIEMGPDQRISAHSGILEKSSNAGYANILGVWNSWDGPIYGKSLSGQGDSIKQTYSPGRESMFRRWLISTKRDKDATKMSAYKTLSNRKRGDRICLVGEGTLGKRGMQGSYIYADLLEMPATGKNLGQFAWWIGGENQKAKISASYGLAGDEDEEESSNSKDSEEPIDVLRNTWDTPPPSFVQSTVLDFLPQEIKNSKLLISRASLPLATSGEQDAGMPYFYDVTTNGYSLATNVRTGGLKHDLSLLLNKKDMANTEFARRSNQDCPIVEQGGDVPEGKQRDMPIGSWQTLHAYYNAWPDGTARASDAFNARLVGSVDDAYTTISGSGIDGGRYFDGRESWRLSKTLDIPMYSTKSLIAEGGGGAGYARVPVLLAFVSSFGLKTELTDMMTREEGESEAKPIYKMGMTFAPMFLWWNPYNVPMRIQGAKMWSHSLPYKMAWLQSYSMRNSTSWDYTWSNYALSQNQYASGLGFDTGNYFIKEKDDETSDIIFAPGEILFFSSSKARPPGGYTVGASNPFSQGYHPSIVSGYSAHFYAGGDDQVATNPGVATKENIEDEKFYLRLRFGVFEDDKERGTPDSRTVFGKDDSQFTVFSGFTGLKKGDNDKSGISPQRMLLGWYDMKDNSQDTSFISQTYWSTNGTQDDPLVPFFIASAGVAVKSANKGIGVGFISGDFRTKTWQHSNPALFPPAIIEPDDQQRSYHPFQLVSINVGGGVEACPLDNIGKNGVLGITTDGEEVSFAANMEIPVHPPFSLAALSGMRLTPGWFKYDGDGEQFVESANLKIVKEYAKLSPEAYMSGVPGVGIGNSFADPTIPADDIYRTHSNKSKLIPDFYGDSYDHGVIINDALWDRFFMSSISDRPEKNGKANARDVLEKFLEGEEVLPVSRYIKAKTPYDNKSIVARLMDDEGWKYVAQYLVIDGGFNVNSTSVEAWAAMIQGLSKRKLVTNVKGKLELVESDKNDDDVLFSRFMVSTTDKSLESLGNYSSMQGSSELRGGSMATAWGEVRMLNPEGIRILAEEIVNQVRERGPFLNMSDFINRRLDSNNMEYSLKGALQAAIDETDINEDFKDSDLMITSTGSGSYYAFPDAAKGSIHTAAPGYLIQSDILMSLGNILTVRDDCFVVRAYGCVKNVNNAILAQAWCEVTVQRCIEYVDPSNSPSESMYDNAGTRTGELSKVNQTLGRKFKIISFRWLDQWDI